MTKDHKPQTTDPDDDQIVAEIEIAAPPDRVFRALTNQADLMQWFTDANGIHRWEMDARRGGRYRYFVDGQTAAVNKASSFECRGEILEYDPPRLLVYSWMASWHADPSRATIVRWELTRTRSGTHVRMTHSGLANEGSARKDYGGGWTAELAHLKHFAEHQVEKTGSAPALLLACLLAVSASTSGHAQQSTLADPLLDSLTGAWILNGTITKTRTTHSVNAEWVLNHQFVRIHEVSRDVAGSPPVPQYEAIVMIGWDAPHDRYIVYWTDTFGGGFSLRGYAPRMASSIPIVFQSDDGRFFTTFDYDKQRDAWRWSMDNEKNGKRQEFARLSLTRDR